MKTYFRKHLAATLMLTLCTSTSSFAASNPASTAYVDELIQATIAQLTTQLTYTAGYGITIDNKVISATPYTASNGLNVSGFDIQGYQAGTGIQIDTSTTPATLNATAGHAIGNTYQGGIIFYLDSASSGQHGLIASVSDNSTTARYGLAANELAVGDGIYAGISNTDAIRSYQASQGDTADSAALTCLTYAIQADGTTACDQTTSAAAGANCYADWYLPSKFEMIQLALQASVVGLSNNQEYWSSSSNPFNSQRAYTVTSSGSLVFVDSVDKSFLTGRVRCIRAF